MKVVTARELKNRTGEVLRRVRAGESVVVTLRGGTHCPGGARGPVPAQAPRVDEALLA